MPTFQLAGDLDSVFLFFKKIKMLNLPVVYKNLTFFWKKEMQSLQELFKN